MLASASPDFLGVLPSLGFWCFVDDLSARIVRASLVGQSRLDILGEIARAGIVLAGAGAFSGTGCRDSEPGVAAFAQIAEILGRSVRFIAIDVIDNQKAG
jgi:hypothetical protein